MTGDGVGVPEPGSMVLLVLGLAFICLRARQIYGLKPAKLVIR